jgi:hypothetical protein
VYIGKFLKKKKEIESEKVRRGKRAVAAKKLKVFEKKKEGVLTPQQSKRKLIRIEKWKPN